MPASTSREPCSGCRGRADGSQTRGAAGRTRAMCSCLALDATPRCGTHYVVSTVWGPHTDDPSSRWRCAAAPRPRRRTPCPPAPEATASGCWYGCAARGSLSGLSCHRRLDGGLGRESGRLRRPSGRALRARRRSSYFVRAPAGGRSWRARSAAVVDRVYPCSLLADRRAVARVTRYACVTSNPSNALLAALFIAYAGRLSAMSSAPSATARGRARAGCRYQIKPHFIANTLTRILRWLSAGAAPTSKTNLEHYPRPECAFLWSTSYAGAGAPHRAVRDLASTPPIPYHEGPVRRRFGCRSNASPEHRVAARSAMLLQPIVETRDPALLRRGERSGQPAAAGVRVIRPGERRAVQRRPARSHGPSPFSC